MTTTSNVPAYGRFGGFGGRYVPEALIPALEQLEEVWRKAVVDPAFVGELERLQRTYTGRPSIITEVPRFAEHCGGARVILKREDLNHTGSHKINNVLGQALLTKRMGKTRVIAETGAGQHGVATATACALFGLECTIYMGEIDTQRQALNVARMRMLGAEVIAVHALGLLEPTGEGGTAPAQGQRDTVRHELDTAWCAPLHTAGLPTRHLLRDGSPVAVVLAVADEEDADLIVLGSRGLGGYPELLLGSTLVVRVP